MPRRPSTPYRPGLPEGVAPATPTEPVTEDQLARWAGLIAEGRAGFPDGLSAPQLGQLSCEVRRLRRARLVRWIARAVAHDLHRGPGLSSGG
jgi:hypothetical protein